MDNLPPNWFVKVGNAAAALIVLAWVAAMVFLFAGCPHPGPGPVPPPTLLDGPASCSSACSRARALGCDYARPTAEGASCEDVCGAYADTVPFNVDCRTRAISCREAERCER